MGNRRIVITCVLVGLVIAGGAWWFLHRGATRVPASVPGGLAGTSQASKPGAERLAARAHALVTVKDSAGPVVGAAVRFARSGGDVIVVTTGTDGIARTDLEPGAWSISGSAVGHEPAALAARTLAAGANLTLDLVLPIGGRTLTGAVTDTSGGAISGARIDAAKLAGLARPGDAVATTTTGPDGRYALAVAEGPLLVAVSDPDYAPQSRYVEVGATGATASFQLVPGGVIEGVVRDERDRTPIAGARVEARLDAPAMLLGEAAEHRVTAGPDGRFRIAGLRPGSFELRARGATLASRTPTVVGLGVAEQVTDVVLLIGAAALARGIVLDEHGAPAGGVEVSAMSRDRDVRATSDAKGAFVLEGLAPGKYIVMGSSDVFVPAGSTPLELADRDVDHLEVRVRRGLRVSGHVEPRQVCEVRLDFGDRTLGPREMPMLVEPVTTGPDGAFELGPASPLPYMIAARCPGGDQGAQAIHVTAGMPDVIVHVAPGASIAGRVVDGHGKPVTAVTVMAAPQAGSERTVIVNGIVTSGAQAVTGATGAFELRGLAAGSYKLRVLERGRPIPLKSTDSRVALAGTEHKTGVELAIDRPDGVIRGTVTGPDGQPLADAWVSVHQGLEDLVASMEHGGTGEDSGESRMITVEDRDDGGGAGAIAPVVTDATGHFEITGLARVPWLVVAEAHAGALRGRATKVLPDATITIQALGVTELHGIVHAPSGSPGTFSVELDGPTHAQRSFASPDGTFAFTRVDPGAYTVRVTSSAGHGEAQVQVAAGLAATVEVNLAANAVVAGTVVDGAGKPMPGVAVTVVPDSPDGHIRIAMEGPPPMTAADGTFRIETKAGPSVLVVMVEPRPVTRKGLALEAGKTLDLGPITVDVGPPPKP